MSDQDRDYSNSEIVVHWRPEKCVHCENCITELPSVFNVNARPWVDLSRVPSEYLRRNLNCPSGALTISEVTK